MKDMRDITDEELTSLTVQLIRSGIGLFVILVLALILGRNTYMDFLYVIRRPTEDILFTALTIVLTVGCLSFLVYFCYLLFGQIRDLRSRQAVIVNGLVEKSTGLFKSFSVAGKKFRVHSSDFATFENGANVKVAAGPYSNSVLKIYRQN